MKKSKINSVKSTQRYVVLDVETTGLSPRNGDRVVEIGAIAIEGKCVIEEFHSLVHVRKRIPMPVQQVHGITNEMLMEKPEPEKVYSQFQEFIGDSVLVAHNAPFDIGFLRHEFGRLGLGLNNRCLCTLEMSRRRYPTLPDHRLATVFRHLFKESTEETQQHRALSDARMVARIWLVMTEKMSHLLDTSYGRR